MDFAETSTRVPNDRGFGTSITQLATVI